jgi:ubiquinone/menaquinone biosynthesis C-methylase UbiE
MNNKLDWEKHTGLWGNKEYYDIGGNEGIIGWLKKIPKGKALDEGCGTAQYTISLAMLGFNVVGIDFSSKLLKIAKEKVKKYKVSRKCSFVLGDIRKLPFRDSSFDAVLSAGIIEHVPETEKCIQQINRVLKPNGYLIIHVPHKISFFTINKILQKLFGIWSSGYEKSFTKPSFRTLLRKNGFTIIKEVTPEIEPRSFVTRILRALDKPIRIFGLGGHHIVLFCKKI